ncbi:hypothetical protein [Streptacidiphilus cavernicola]|uniref:Uncharacterized protein n=1 Tax=Streptacidiphilus cavernicola TaxID=3342716 RepID=A0ABV6W3Z8_9ACTN
MSKVKNRDRKQKSNGHADHSVKDGRTSKATMIDMHEGDSSPVLTPTAVVQSAPRKKERRYGHN